MRTISWSASSTLAPLLAALLLGFSSTASAAPKRGDLGFGLTLGDPAAGTAKYFLDERQALLAGLGVSVDFTALADYQYHFWNLLPQPKRGALAVYGDLGVRLETGGYNNALLRVMPGLSYWPTYKRSFEFFLELGPGLRLAPDVRWRLEGGFGLRVYR